MNIEKQYQEDHQMKLTIQVEPESLEAARQRAARKIAKQTKIPGFRPGKAPYNVVLRTIGEAAIFEEAVEILANDIYPKAIEEAGIEPYGPGQFDNITSMDPLTLEFSVPLAAEVTLGEYRSIRIPYQAPIITDIDVEKVLNDLRERQAILAPVERPIIETDQVTIILAADLKEAKDGQNSTLVEERSTTINIRKIDDAVGNEWPFPGFSRHLIGLSVGQKETITYTYPPDSEWESLRGREAEFKFTVETVKSRELPSADDEFAHAIGEYKTLEELTAEIRSSLEEQSLNEYNDDYNQQILAKILDNTTTKYPKQMLENEIVQYINQLESQLAQQGLDLETYLKTRQMDEKALKEEVKPLAELRLKQTLAILKVTQQENVTVTNEEIETESSKVLAQISKHMTQDQAKKAINEGYIRNLVGNINTDLLIRHTYERLQSIAKGEHEAKEDTKESAADTELEITDSPEEVHQTIDQPAASDDIP